MSAVAKLVAHINVLQQKHPVLGFPYAVIKKFGDDEAAYEGALITYYGFLSLFPLLLVATSVIEIIAKHNDHLRTQFINGFNHYFPIIGERLQTSVHGSGKTGLTLALGALIALYGARGGAAALQHALDNVWQVPRNRRPGFPKSLLTNLSIIVVGGIGLLAAAVLSGLATSLGHSWQYKLVPSLISIVVLFGTFVFVFKAGSATKLAKTKDYMTAAIIAAIGFQILQSLGGYYITHQLKSLNSLYGTFAIVLGLLAWIYLQAQIMLYALEVATVRTLGLWPRSLEADKPTEQDHRAYQLYTSKGQLGPTKHE